MLEDPEAELKLMTELRKPRELGERRLRYNLKLMNILDKILFEGNRHEIPFIIGPFFEIIMFYFAKYKEEIAKSSYEERKSDKAKISIVKIVKYLYFTNIFN